MSFVSWWSHLRCNSRHFSFLLLVIFRQWGRLITRHNLCQKGLPVIGASWSPIVPASSCSLSGLLLYHSSVVVLSLSRHPCFRNFYLTIQFMWVASLTLCVCWWGPWSINLTSFQIGKLVSWVCSEMEVCVQVSHISRCSSFILSIIDLPVSPM